MYIVLEILMLEALCMIIGVIVAEAKRLTVPRFISIIVMILMIIALSITMTIQINASGLTLKVVLQKMCQYLNIIQ